MSEKEFESEEEDEEEEEEAAPKKPSVPAPAPAPAPAAAPAEAAPVEEAPAEEAPVKLKPKPRPEPKEDEEPEMTEAQKAMLAAQKKHEEEEAKRDKEYQERREHEKLSLNDELSALKEKLAERKKIRVEEEANLVELRNQDEEKHRLEREAKRDELEAKKRAKELEMKKSSASCVVPLPIAPTGRNYQPKKKGEKAPKAGEAAEEPSDEENAAETRRQYLEMACKPIDLSGLDPHTLKDKVKSFHARLVKLETAKYDLGRRAEEQAYELLELKEREKQRARQKAKESGLDSEEAAAGAVARPPKVRLASKFDRQTDKRSYGERYVMYEKPFVKKAPKLYHGTPRPPVEFGHPSLQNEELETLRKSMDPAKGRYTEVEVIEGAKPAGVAVVAPQVPDDNAPDEPAPAPAAAAPAAAAPAQAAPAQAAGARQPREVREPVNPFKAMAGKK